ncbi:hypothetical protein E4U53_004248 [Claviceps sorghi]|nr:hypothetical protein E4U53_004248 [Claviceps sorghi]
MSISRAAMHKSPHLRHLDHLGRVDALDNQLRHPVPFLDLKIPLGVVEEQHLDVSPVVCVDDAGARVDEVFAREARAGRDATV